MRQYARSLPIDVARLRPHLRGEQMPALPAKVLQVLDEEPGEVVAGASGDDWVRMRGVPVLGRGVRGAIRGSRPDVDGVR